jgi:hypothetical protein
VFIQLDFDIQIAFYDFVSVGIRNSAIQIRRSFCAALMLDFICIFIYYKEIYPSNHILRYFYNAANYLEAAQKLRLISGSDILHFKIHSSPWNGLHILKVTQRRNNNDLYETLDWCIKWTNCLTKFITLFKF